jgi:hypothetical protein
MTAWSYTNSGTDSDALQIRSVEMTPDPPERGKSLTATIQATALEEIVEGAYLNVVVKLGRIKVSQREYDLFEKLKGDTFGWSLTADTAAGGEPLKPGDVELTFGMDLPKEIPPTQLTLNVRAYTANDGDLCSLDGEFDFRPPVGRQV